MKIVFSLIGLILASEASFADTKVLNCSTADQYLKREWRIWRNGQTLQQHWYSPNGAIQVQASTVEKGEEQLNLREDFNNVVPLKSLPGDKSKYFAADVVLVAENEAGANQIKEFLNLNDLTFPFRVLCQETVQPYPKQ